MSSAADSIRNNVPCTSQACTLYACIRDNVSCTVRTVHVLFQRHVVHVVISEPMQCTCWTLCCHLWLALQASCIRHSRMLNSSCTVPVVPVAFDPRPCFACVLLPSCQWLPTPCPHVTPPPQPPHFKGKHGKQPLSTECSHCGEDIAI